MRSVLRSVRRFLIKEIQSLLEAQENSQTQPTLQQLAEKLFSYRVRETGSQLELENACAIMRVFMDTHNARQDRALTEIFAVK